MNSYTYDIVVREQERLIEDPEIEALYWNDEQTNLMTQRVYSSRRKPMLKC